MSRTPFNSPALPASTPPRASRALETLSASQKLIHLGRMAASIAHEVNNPLESITNLLYLIRMEPGMPQGALAYLDLAEREMERVVTISRQTLNFAREASEPSEVSLPGVLEEVLLLCRRRIGEKQLRIVQRYTRTPAIRIPPGEIRQVLANIIINAIEACGQRGELTLRLHPVLAAQRTPGIRITIADNGTGIAPNVRHRLGEPFFTTKGQGGTGLGLWVTRSIVKRHGGSLRMRSRHIDEPQGKTSHGTVFSFFLPLQTPLQGGVRTQSSTDRTPRQTPDQTPNQAPRPVIVSRTKKPSE